jgi:ATP-dependent RNA helicase RhlE
MSFEKLGLLPEILNGVIKQGYTEPTPIQKQAIPVVLQGRDVLAGAQTGTGKTAAFTLPILHLLSKGDSEKHNSPRVLILVPTRELAAQVGESITLYGEGLQLRTITVYGGVGIKPQIKRLRQGIDIVISTPGRLLDLSQRQEIDLSKIEILTLDEADRMLDMGFINDIKKVMRLIPKKRQTLFFSATYNKEIKKLSDTILTRPVSIEVARQNATAENIEQCVYHIPKANKFELLERIINDGNLNQVLVFTRTKHDANRLTKQLNKADIQTATIHGDKSQGARTRALADFKDYKVRVLVATDIAARGIDIDKLPYVVNFTLPHIPEDYVHRIGRTGRAGSEGKAISFVAETEGKLLTTIEKLLKRTIPVNRIEGLTKQAPRLRPQGAGQGNGSSRGKSQGSHRPKTSSNYKGKSPSRNSSPSRGHGNSNNSGNQDSSESRGNSSNSGNRSSNDSRGTSSSRGSRSSSSSRRGR